MHGLSVIMGTNIPYFAESLILLCTIGRHRMCWCANTKKLIPHRFSSTPELMPDCGISSHTYVCPECNYGKLHTIFCRKSNIIMHNKVTSYVLVCEYQKIDTSQIFVGTRINITFWYCFTESEV